MKMVTGAGSVNSNPISITLFVWFCLLMPFSLLLLKYWYLHLFLVPFNLFSNVRFCYMQEKLISPLYPIYFAISFSVNKTALFIKEVTQISLGHAVGSF